MLNKKASPSHYATLSMMNAFLLEPSTDRYEPGISYVLAMKRDTSETYPHRTEPHYDDLSIHVRTSQPCYGEMRKYKKTHGEAYSNPQPNDDYRPGDLFCDFPSGFVEGYAIRFDRYVRYEGTALSNMSPVLEFLFSDQSPWRKGFGTSRDVELVRRGDLIVGVIGTNTNVDPTVLVSLIQFISRSLLSSNGGVLWNKYVEHGMTPLEATVAMMLVSYDPTSSNGLQFSNAYYLPIFADVRRMMEGDPLDLTGKTWREGGDYNRKRLQDVFKNESPDAVVPVKEIVKEIDPSKLTKGRYDRVSVDSIETFIPAFRKVVERLSGKMEVMPSLLDATTVALPPSGCMPLKKRKKKDEAKAA